MVTTDPAYSGYVLSRQSRLRRTAYLLSGDHDLAEDLLQEALVALAEKWESVEHPDAFVRTVLARQRVSWWRRRRREVTPGMLPETAVGDGAADRARNDEVHTALRALPWCCAISRTSRIPDDLSGLRVPDPTELVGSDWSLQDEVWGSDLTSAEVVGSASPTTFSFASADSRGWGFSADNCGGGWFQDNLTLSDAGTFPAGADLATDGQGCLEPAQTAEDFWIDVLSHGGSLHLLGDDWLLLSVDDSWAGVEEPPPVAVRNATRLDFVRAGVDPTTVDTTLPERAPTNEELAGTDWALWEWVEGGGVLADLTTDPSRLGLSWAEEFPEQVVVSLEGCDVVTVHTLGVNALGGTVPPEDGDHVDLAQGCPGAEAVGPVLAEAFFGEVQFTLIGDDLLVLRLVLPGR